MKFNKATGKNAEPLICNIKNWGFAG